MQSRGLPHNSLQILTVPGFTSGAHAAVERGVQLPLPGIKISTSKNSVSTSFVTALASSLSLPQLCSQKLGLGRVRFCDGEATAGCFHQDLASKMENFGPYCAAPGLLQLFRNQKKREQGLSNNFKLDMKIISAPSWHFLHSDLKTETCIFKRKIKSGKYLKSINLCPSAGVPTLF